ncbi:hypothetical protein V2J09_021623 [Rumex salicifolius]
MDRITDEKRPMLIAMQGDPLTGKTALANNLAKYLKCSSIRLDDILKVMSPSTPSHPETAAHIMSQAYDVVVRMVKTQISQGLTIILDSPLSRRTHLEKLYDMLRHYGGPHPSRLVIVECKPKNVYFWQMWFDQRAATLYKDKWHNPDSWPFDQKFSRDYTDDDVISLDARNQRLVPKLVVNSSDPYLTFGVISVLYNLIATDDGRRTEYAEWWPVVRAKQLESNKLGITEPLCDSKVGHHVNLLMKQGDLDQDSVNCGVCLGPFHVDSEPPGMAYKCSGCPYAMHESCAELDGSTKVHNFPKFIRTNGVRWPETTVTEYCYPEEHLCAGHKGGEYSYECGYCVFETHVKCKLVPTIVLRPAAHDHPLYFWTDSTLISKVYQCMACRHSVILAGYLCVERCMFYYHAECLLLPPTVPAHQHGGYTHDLELVLHREEALEDYLCIVCFKQMNPEAWFYRCKKCTLELDLDCAFKIGCTLLSETKLLAVVENASQILKIV